MKRFVVSTAVASLAFIGAGAVVDKVIGSSKSDEKALEIIAKARTAIGGNAAIASVKSFVIKGQTSKTININGADHPFELNSFSAYSNQDTVPACPQPCSGGSGLSG